MRGLFITLEGIDGCGKSTHLSLLAEHCRARGLDVAVTREPGGTPLGEQIRALMLSGASVGIAPVTELCLMASDRAQHVAESIRPDLEAGRTVISDRYTDSTVAFQGYGRGLDLSMIDRLNQFATGGLTPRLTILFDLEPRLARSRLGQREVGGLLGALDDEQLDFHERVREGYLKLASAEPDRIRIVDSSGPTEQTHARAIEIVDSILSSEF
jgi:dTMP kinase